MNVGDGLKLETEILDGKPRLILASYVGKSKSTVKMGNKVKLPKHALKIKQAEHFLKSTQNTCAKHEHFSVKPRSESRLSTIKGENTHVTLLSTQDSKEISTGKHTLIVPKDNTNGKSNLQNPKIAVKRPKQKIQKPRVSAEDLRNSLVCLTQEQLEQILMTVKEGTKTVSQVQDEKQGTGQAENSAITTTAANQIEEENIMGLLQKAAEASSAPRESNSDSSTKQAASLQDGRKIIIKNTWKPADMFSTLGEKEGDKTLLEAKRAQWKKELDEQVALKKKLKETSEVETKCYFRGKPSIDKTHLENLQTAYQAQIIFPTDLNITAEENHIFRTTLTTETSEVAPSISYGPTGHSSSFMSPDLPAAIRTAFVLGETTPVEDPISTVKCEQQKKWLEELDKQKEEAKLQKIEEKHNLSKAEEHDRWAMHFDSLKNHLSANQQHPLNGTYKKQPEILCLSPDPKELTAFIHPFSPAALGHTLSSKVDNVGKTVESSALEQSQKANFLRSMTALLDPAQIEERDRRRQKQLEHQKAIMAQVEEKRRKKQLEEEQRKWEEQEEERRLARERELMQKQFEEDMLKQKEKDEIMTLKTNKLYQTMQKAQELAQRLKQEQRIRDLAQKGHDISKLQKNLAGEMKRDTDGHFKEDLRDIEGNGAEHGQTEPVAELGSEVLIHGHDNSSEDISSKMDQNVKETSPRRDTAVQTDYFNSRVCINSESCIEKRNVDSTSPDISIEYKEKFNSKKCQKEMQCPDKKKISEKENNGTYYSAQYDQFARQEKQTKPMGKYGKRPDWNINKPGKRYIPASERYPQRLQRQREEKKVRRQMELLQLVERNIPGNLCIKKGPSPERSPLPHQKTDMMSKGHTVRKEEPSPNIHEERYESPPVPAVKNRLYQIQQKQMNASNFPVHNGNIGRTKNTNADMQQRKSSPFTEPERPPSSHFIPYVRTNEVYYLDPDAPMTRPSTHDPQYQQFNDSYHTPRQIFSSDHVRDPLLNPEVVKNKDRQQAILKGLSELRQGLLQKQKELETRLIPAITQEESFLLPF